MFRVNGWLKGFFKMTVVVVVLMFFLSITNRNYVSFKHGSKKIALYGRCIEIVDSISDILKEQNLLFPSPGAQEAIIHSIKNSALCNYDPSGEYVCMVKVSVGIVVSRDILKGLSYYDLIISCYDGITLLYEIAKNKNVNDTLILRELNQIYYMNITYSTDGSNIYTNFNEKFSESYNPFYGHREINEFKKRLETVLKEIKRL